MYLLYLTHFVNVHLSTEIRIYKHKLVTLNELLELIFVNRRTLLHAISLVQGMLLDIFFSGWLLVLQ